MSTSVTINLTDPEVKLGVAARLITGENHEPFVCLDLRWRPVQGEAANEVSFFLSQDVAKQLGLVMYDLGYHLGHGQDFRSDF